ncbi:ferritin-like fold-containing protein [Aurantimicrobium minutum]|uniref:ferritin-like fold-containing protein n=1 Tax=Aurantimicrobium minutum TaxID=708131 RepID=UPI00248E06F9|nr:ferritin-like fold-containing protein [Aurantimicrobium minutum]
MFFSWFGLRKRRVVAPTLKPRQEKVEREDKVDLSDMTPDVVPYLGQVAYFELAVFESLTRAVTAAPNLEAKEGLSAAAGEVLAKHHGLVAELRKKKVDPAMAMAPFAPAIDTFEELTSGRNWYEMLLGVYLTAGFLDDFFVRLVTGLPKALRPRIEEILKTDRTADVIVNLLKEGIAADPKLASQLALWGRRLVGDTQLVARSALQLSGNHDDDEQRLEPVFTDLIAAHSRRMDELGLTA